MPVRAEGLGGQQDLRGPVQGTVADWLLTWMAGSVLSDLKPQIQGGYRRHVEQMIPRSATCSCSC